MDGRKRLDRSYQTYRAGENPVLSWDQGKGAYSGFNHDQSDERGQQPDATFVSTVSR